MVNKKNLTSILFGIIFLLSITTFIFAWSDILAGAGYEVMRQPITATPNLTFNITEDGTFNATIEVNNTQNGLSNITEVNITLPSSCTFNASVDGNNANNWTDANGSSGAFANFSTTRYGTAGSELRWRNASAGVTGFLSNGSNETTWFSFNFTCTTPGTYNGQYNITVSVLNGTKNYTLYYLNMTVNDTTPPNFSSSLSPTKNNNNYSGNFTFNISITDNWLNNNWVNGMIGKAGINMTIWNSTGFGKGTNQSLDMFGGNFSNVSGNYWNFTLNTSLFADGVYNFTIFFNDTSGNINSTNITNVRFDNTAPGEVNITNATGTNFDVVKNVSGNFSNTIILNFTVVDNVTLAQDMWVNISNANGTNRGQFYGRASSPRAIGSIVYFNISVDTTTIQDGLYNITVYTNNSAVNNNGESMMNTTNIFRQIMRIDNTAPSEVNITNATGTTFDVLKNVSGNFSNTIILNFTVVDNVVLAQDMWVNISNANGTNRGKFYGRASSPRAIGSIVYFNISVDTTTIPDGLYNITIYTNNSLLDNGGGSMTNTTTIFRQIMRIDNTDPTGSYSCSPSSVSTGQTTTCSCTPSDTGGSGINTSATSSTASTSASDTGIHTVSCNFADLAGNTGTTTATYNVESSGSGASSSSGSGGGSSSASYYTTTIPTGQELSEVQTVEKQVSAKSRVSIKINEESHYIGVRTLTDTSALIEIMSDPIQVNLAIGQDTKVDVNNDKTYDVYVKLNSIKGGKADLTIKYLNEPVPTGVGSVETTGEIISEPEEEQPTGEDTSVTDATKKTSSKWLWIGIGIAIVLVLVGVGYKMKKK